MTRDEYFYAAHGLKVTKGCSGCQLIKDSYNKGYDDGKSEKPKWIPVSQQLPEPFTFVNATCRSLVDNREDWTVETIYLPIPKAANKHGYSDWGNIPMLNWGDAEVIAWMERIIPKPYVVEGQQGENT